MKSFGQWSEEFSFDQTRAARAERLWQTTHRGEFPCLVGDDHYYLLRGRLEQLYSEMGRSGAVPAGNIDGMIKFYNGVVDEYVRTRHPELYATWRHINGLDD